MSPCSLATCSSLSRPASNAAAGDSFTAPPPSAALMTSPLSKRSASCRGARAGIMARKRQLRFGTERPHTQERKLPAAGHRAAAPAQACMAQLNVAAGVHIHNLLL